MVYPADLIETDLDKDSGKVVISWMDVGFTSAKYSIYRHTNIINSLAILSQAELLGIVNSGIEQYIDNVDKPGSYYYTIIMEIDSIENLVYICEQSNTLKTEQSIYSNIISSNHDFTEPPWGISRVKVFNTVRLTLDNLFSGDCYLVYYGEIAGLKASIRYTFNDDNKLTDIVYNIREEYTEDESYVLDYYRLKEMLNSIYGNSNNIIDNWNSWNTNTTTISLRYIPRVNKPHIINLRFSFDSDN
jgi:hypothetical protein